MSLHQTLVAKYGGKPILLLIAGVGFTISFYGFYTVGYKPWSRRKMLREAEQYANFIFEKENNKKD